MDRFKCDHGRFRFRCCAELIQSDSNSKSNNFSVDSLVVAFWAMGLLNNLPYVIMLAGAKEISEGGTALVFVANVLPSLLIKLSAPYWFHHVSYGVRILAGSCLFGASFLTVAYFSSCLAQDDSSEEELTKRFIGLELVGVMFGSLACGMGESSLLALGGKFASINLDADSGSEIDRPTAKYLTGFSSGTGIAGVMGYAYVTVIHFWCGFSFATTLLVANAFAVAYSWIFFRYLDGKVFAPKSKEDLMSIHNGNCSSDLDNSNLFEMIQPKDENHSDTKTLLFRANLNDEIQCSRPRGFSKLDTESINLPNMTLLQKSRLVVSLWPYMIPLFVVYAAEYALQSGTWTAIGFPVHDEQARNRFYAYSNWTYQIGVFLSRSSGTIFQASMDLLWFMPALQVVNLLFFMWTASSQIWYNWWLLTVCLLVGCIGGGVYVNAYTRINSDLPPHLVEFALSSASVADSFGILLADVSGLFIQSCLYAKHQISGATVSCPFS